jgi:flagellar basal-body rod protein FlgG
MGIAFLAVLAFIYTADLSLFLKPSPEGKLIATGKRFDLAIEGQGFFVVELPSGECGYTRWGQFRLNSTGQLVAKEGYRVSPQITVPEKAVSVGIDPDGKVRVLISDERTLLCIGQITLSRFPNPFGLSKDARGYYTTSDQSGEPIWCKPGSAGAGKVRQGFLEKRPKE